MKHFILRLFLVVVITGLIGVIIRLDKSWWVLFSVPLGYFYCFANGLIDEKFKKGDKYMIRPEKVDFSNAQVGDKVTCLVKGKGWITEISEEDYPITAEFSGDEDSYTINGQIYAEECPYASLFYGHFDGWPTEENLVRPESPVTFEKDEKVIVGNNGEKYKRYYSHFDRGVHYIFPHGTNSWSAETPMQWSGKIRKPTKEELIGTSND